MQIKDAEFQQDLAMEQAKTQADIQAKFAKLEADLTILREKNMAKQIDKGVL